MLVIDAAALVELLTDDAADIPEVVARVGNAEWMSAPDLLDYEVLTVLRKMVLRSDIEVQLAGALPARARRPEAVSSSAHRGDGRARVGASQRAVGR